MGTNSGWIQSLTPLYTEIIFNQVWCKPVWLKNS